MIDTHQELLIALAEAAELEHSLICQYLFAAYSIKADAQRDGLSEADLVKFRRWRERVLTVARQEMGHLGTVWNLLALVGGAPHSERANFPQPAGRYYPPNIDFALTPFNRGTLDRFVAFEQPDTPVTLEVVPPDPLVYAGVSGLYRQIKAAISALPDDQLLINVAAVEDKESWSNNVTLKAAVTRQQALDAVDFIVLQGEGSPASQANSHYKMFISLRDELDAHLQAGGTDPARKTLANPITAPHRDATGGTMIRDKRAVRAIASFNLLYGSLLLGLRHYYSGGSESEDQHENLKMACYRLMHDCLGPLGILLTRLPAGLDDPEIRAAPSFEIYGPEALSNVPAVVWRVVAFRLAAVKAELLALAAETGEAEFTAVAAGVDRALEWLPAVATS